MKKKIELHTEYVADGTRKYWTDGKAVYYKGYLVRGAKPDNFYCFDNNDIFAIDDKYCYILNSRIAGADVNTFQILNATYAKDKNHAYCFAGKIKEADPSSFQGLDDYYASDNNHVFFYDYEGNVGKAKMVKKADPKTFVPLNGGAFGKDDNNIFSWGLPLNKANVETWVKFSAHPKSYYSKDDKRIYYLNREVKEADYHTFEVLIPPNDGFNLTQLAKDKNQFYFCELIISEEEYQKMI